MSKVIQFPHAQDTNLAVQFPFGRVLGGRALCVDGKVRSLSRVADTSADGSGFSCTVRVSGRHVSGRINMKWMDSSSAVVFEANPSGRNAALISA